MCWRVKGKERCRRVMMLLKDWTAKRIQSGCVNHEKSVGNCRQFLWRVPFWERKMLGGGVNWRGSLSAFSAVFQIKFPELTGSRVVLTVSQSVSHTLMIIWFDLIHSYFVRGVVASLVDATISVRASTSLARQKRYTCICEIKFRKQSSCNVRKKPLKPAAILEVSILK